MRSYVFAGLLVLALVIPAVFLLPSGRNLAVGSILPFLRGKAALTQTVREHLQDLTPPTAAEKQRLRYYQRLVSQLQVQLQNSRNAVKENREFRQYYDLPGPADWKLIVAPLIARDPVTWNRRFRIGKGDNHGVLTGAAVLAGNQVIGRVMEVTANSALVVTLADPSCRVGVRLPGVDVVGILNGRLDQKWYEPPICLVNYLPRDQSYKENDPAVTSGLGGAMPAGLFVGRVTRWEDGAIARIVGAAYVQLRVRPTAEYNSFRYVAVVVPRGPAPEVTDDAAELPPGEAPVSDRGAKETR